MKIGLLGGSFDPIHKGHIHIAKKALEKLDLDEVWFVVANISPFKANGAIASYDDRCKMVELAIEKYPEMKISYLEKELEDERSYTINLAKKLHENNNGYRYYYLIGDDLLTNLHKWKDIEKLATIFQFVCFNRHEKSHENVEKFNVITIDNEVLPYASSLIRDGDLSGLADVVLNYCSHKNIYLSTMIKAYMSEKRYAHTMSMLALAKEINECKKVVDDVELEVACMLHDIGKEMDIDLQRKIVEKIHPQLLGEKWQWHQHVSAYLALKDFKVTNTRVLKAIAVHTSCDMEMDKLSMLVYLADKLDRSRNYDSENEIGLAKESIEKSFVKTLEKMFDYEYDSVDAIKDEMIYSVYLKYKERNSGGI